MPEAPHIPRFAVVGRINKGKSSILATLVEEADNAHIRVSPTPGETTRCQRIPLVLDGETLIEFIDTPGFCNAPETLAWMQTRHAEADTRPRIETVRDFVREHRGDDRFIDECRLLEPVLDGAGIVYVVDASKPFRPDYLAEMEILRWTGRPRMALLNSMSDDADFSSNWKTHLGEYFNLTREFNAHHARFAERIRLLKQLLEIEDDRKDAIEKTIRLLEDEWTQRRDEAADLILQTIEDCLAHRAKKNVADTTVRGARRQKKAIEELKDDYIRSIRKLEDRGLERLTRLYKHQPAPPPQNGDLAGHSESLVNRADLFAEETWQFLGLNKWQLAIAGGVAGGAAGAAVDLAVLGQGLGLPTAIGAATGFTASLIKGKALANIKIDVPFLAGGKASAGGVQIVAGPSTNPNFPWILLDRALSHYHQLLIRAHGRRDPFVIAHSAGAKAGYTTKLSAGQRNDLQRLFTRLRKGRPAPDTEPAFNALASILQSIESAS